MALTPIPPPDPPPPRRTTRPLPVHRHLPGLEPHPSTLGWDPKPDFDFACDLFDHRHYLEAHEVWEAEWRTLDRDSVDAWLVQGLLCAAAYVVKHHTGVTDGASRILTRCHHSLRAVVDQRGPEVRGLHIVELFRRLHAYGEGGPWPLLPPALRAGAPP